ncbi:MAG: glycosyl hydrolase family 18 protein [bacterium]|nr:glycosyl hydrolase family 18 protein [bacterium]
MVKKIGIIIIGVLLGIGLYFAAAHNFPALPTHKKEVIGFLPYWLLNKANKDYSKYISTLTYFGLIIDGDGKILKKNNPQEEEPGWNALNSGKVDSIFSNAKDKNVVLSLLVFAGDEESIGMFLNHPAQSSKNLVEDIAPLMRRYGFTNLNLDIESVKEASDSARASFVQFVQGIKNNLDEKELGTLTLEISPTDIIKKRIINVARITPIVDTVVLMAYDYHYSGSFVTGPVAPLFGAGTISEFDTEAAIQKAIKIIPPGNLILGVPLYGYEWESINSTPRSAVIPGSGIVASNFRAEKFLESCSTCSAELDIDAHEQYIIYKDQEVNTYHQIFYPDKNAIKDKLNFVSHERLGGIALWALGYEGDTILNPIAGWKLF